LRFYSLLRWESLLCTLDLSRGELIAASIERGPVTAAYVVSNQPPVNPALRKPVTTYEHRPVSRQRSSVR